MKDKLYNLLYGSPTQMGGVNYTSETGGPLESNVVSLSGAESVDINSLLIYLNYRSGNSKSIAEEIAEKADLFTEISEQIMDRINLQEEIKIEHPKVPYKVTLNNDTLIECPMCRQFYDENHIDKVTKTVGKYRYLLSHGKQIN